MKGEKRAGKDLTLHSSFSLYFRTEKKGKKPRVRKVMRQV